jgi:hypothetical protein
MTSVKQLIGVSAISMLTMYMSPEEFPIGQIPDVFQPHQATQ